MPNETIGNSRVRGGFNPSEGSINTEVNTIKHLTAGMIDFVESMQNRDPRLAMLAQTAYEEAAMWAVKLATSEVKPEVDEIHGLAAMRPSHELRG